MTEAGGGFDLPEKPLPPEGGRELRRQYLDRDGAMVLQVLREVDRCHPPAAELALDGVPPAEGGPNRGEHVSHGELGHERLLHDSEPRGWAAEGRAQLLA